MKNFATEEQAAKIQAALAAMIDALESVGALSDSVICLAAAGCVAGSIAAATADPAEAIRSVNAVMAGITDGTLLD